MSQEWEESVAGTKARVNEKKEHKTIRIKWQYDEIIFTSAQKKKRTEKRKDWEKKPARVGKKKLARGKALPKWSKDVMMHLPIKGNRVILKLFDRGRSLSHGAMNLGNKLWVSWENTEHPEEEDKCQGQERRGRSHQRELSRVSSARSHSPPGTIQKQQENSETSFSAKLADRLENIYEDFQDLQFTQDPRKRKQEKQSREIPAAATLDGHQARAEDVCTTWTSYRRGADRSPYLRRGSETVGAAEKPLAPIHRIWWLFQRKEHLHCFPTASTLGPFFYQSLIESDHLSVLSIIYLLSEDDHLYLLC